MDTSCSLKIRANLKTSMASVKASLSGINPSESNGRLSCNLISDKLHSCIAEFFSDCILVQMDFDIQEPRFYNESLASLLSLACILQHDYEFEMGDLYSYIIEALHQNWQSSIRSQDQAIALFKMRIECLGKSNAALSNAVVELSGENASLAAQVAPMKEFCTALFKHSKRHNADAKLFESIAKEFKIAPELSGRVAAAL